jgi:flagellar assembly protein FliH
MTAHRSVLHNVVLTSQVRRLSRPSNGADDSSAPRDSATELQRDAMVLSEPALSDPGANAPGAAHSPQPPAADTSFVDTSWARGHQVGYDEGYAVGARQAKLRDQQEIEQLAEGLAKEQLDRVLQQTEHAALTRTQQAHAEMQQQYDRLTALLHSIPEEFNRYLSDAEDDMLSLAHEVVCRFLGDSAVSLPSLRAQLRQCLKAWHGRAMLSVHLHPDDVDLLRADEDTAELLRASGFGVERSTLRWVADPTVLLGGCQFRSSEGALDARLEVQLQALKTTLVTTRESRKHQLSSASLERPV